MRDVFRAGQAWATINYAKGLNSKFVLFFELKKSFLNLFKKGIKLRKKDFKWIEKVFFTK